MADSAPSAVWGAHSFRVLAIAFCDRELFLRVENSIVMVQLERNSSPQNAATSTLQASAPQIIA